MAKLSNKRGAPSQWSFGPISARGSIESTTILTTGKLPGNPFYFSISTILSEHIVLIMEVF